MEFPAINPQNKEDLQDLHKAMEKQLSICETRGKLIKTGAKLNKQTTEQNSFQIKSGRKNLISVEIISFFVSKSLQALQTEKNSQKHRRELFLTR